MALDPPQNVCRICLPASVAASQHHHSGTTLGGSVLAVTSSQTNSSLRSNKEAVVVAAMSTQLGMARSTRNSRSIYGFRL